MRAMPAEAPEVTLLLLWRARRIPEPVLILADGEAGLLLAS
jgi:hypothetical protein